MLQTFNYCLSAVDDASKEWHSPLNIQNCVITAVVKTSECYVAAE
jgi:hypothetical protein